MTTPWSRLFRRFGPSRNARTPEPMSCAEVGALLQQFLDRELDAERSAELSAHLEECVRCGLEAETYERIKRSLAHRAEPVPPASLERLREFGLSLSRGDGGHGGGAGAADPDA
jgi:hypothetical protein